MNTKNRVCDDIGLLDRSGEVQGIEEIKLLRSCFAGGVEDVITDMGGVFLDPGEKIECCTRTCTMFSSFSAHPHDAVEHECEKADQRMRMDAIRQPVMNGCYFDIGLQNAETAFDIGQRLVVCDGFRGREIGCVGQQRQLSNSLIRARRRSVCSLACTGSCATITTI